MQLGRLSESGRSWLVIWLIPLLLQRASAFPPKIIKTVPTVGVVAGEAFNYQFDASSFQSNKVGGQLTYTLQDAVNTNLPSWLTFSASNVSIQGTPIGGHDSQYEWTLTATDRDGEASSQNFTFNSFAPCPAGSFRHFRLRLALSNQASYYQNGPGSYICSILWNSGSAGSGNGTSVEDKFPSSDLPAANISGTTYTGTNLWSDAPATPQEGFGDPEDNPEGFCSFRSSWKVSAPCHAAYT